MEGEGEIMSEELHPAWVTHWKGYAGKLQQLAELVSTQQWGERRTPLEVASEGLELDMWLELECVVSALLPVLDIFFAKEGLTESLIVEEAAMELAEAFYTLFSLPETRETASRKQRYMKVFQKEDIPVAPSNVSCSTSGRWCMAKLQEDFHSGSVDSTRSQRAPGSSSVGGGTRTLRGSLIHGFCYSMRVLNTFVQLCKDRNQSLTLHRGSHMSPTRRSSHAPSNKEKQKHQMILRAAECDRMLTELRVDYEESARVLQDIDVENGKIASRIRSHQRGKPREVVWYGEASRQLFSSKQWRASCNLEFEFLVESFHRLYRKQGDETEMESAVVHARMRSITGVNSLAEFRMVVSYIIAHLNKADWDNPRQSDIQCIGLLKGLVPDDPTHISHSRHTEIQDLLNSLGATSLAIGLFSRPDISAEVMQAVVALLRCLLGGGRTLIQDTIHEHLVKAHDDAFVQQLRRILEDAGDTVKSEFTLRQDCAEAIRLGRHVRTYDSTATKAADFRASRKRTMLYPLPLVCDILAMVQTTCENHHSNNQNFMRSQRFGAVGSAGQNVNLVSKTVDFFSVLCKDAHSLNKATCRLLEQTLATLTEFVQGPCLENQVAVVESNFIETSRHLLYEFYWHRSGSDVDYMQEKEVKRKLCVLLLALLEQRLDTRHHERMWNALSLDRMKVNLIVIYSDFLALHSGNYSDQALWGPTDVITSRQEAGCHEALWRSCVNWLCAGRNSTLPNTPQSAMLQTGFSMFILMLHLVTWSPANRQLWAPEVRGDGWLKTLREQGASLRSSNIGGIDTMRRLIVGDGTVDVDTQMYLQDPKKLAEDWEQTFNFFNSKTKSVEVVLSDGMLHKCYFPLMPLCTYLSERTKEKIKQGIRRNTATEKIQDLLKYRTEVIDEMNVTITITWPL